LISDIARPRPDSPCRENDSRLHKETGHAQDRDVHPDALLHRLFGAYALTGSIAIGGLVAAIEPLCNSVGFYVHEKVWQRFERNKRRAAIPKHAWLHHQA
jgi:uncharacterized membrane protein